MGEEGANYRPTVEHSEQAGEPDGWNVGVDMIRSAVYHSYYSLKTSWQDITEGNALFPKGVDGEIYLTGGKCFQDESDPEFEEELKNYCWFSYRKGFSGLPDLSYDTGWGCVHRAGQMTIMTALNRHLGCPYYNLLPHFRDLDHACFSIQNIANTGRKYGKEPGQWFAVSTIAHVLKDIVTEQSRGEKGFLTAKPMHVEVVSEQTVKCKNLLSCLENDMACLTLIPCMLGMYFIEGTYATFFLDSLKSKFSVGVIGGKPNHALYFIGCKGNHLIHLDPHRVQDAYVNPSTKGAFTEPRKHSVPMTEIDTCCLMTFYTADRKELLELLEFLNGMQFEYGAATYPAFFLSDYDTLVKGGSAKKRPTAKGKQKRGEACRRAKCKARDGAEPRDDNNPPAPPQGEPAAAAGTGAELNESGDVNGLTDHNEEEATNAASELPTEDVKAWADKQSGQALSSSEPESA